MVKIQTIGELLTEVFKKLDRLNKKVEKLELLLKIDDKWYSTKGSNILSTSNINANLSKNTPFEPPKGSIAKTEQEKQQLIADIQEAQRRKVEEDPDKRKELIEQRKQKEAEIKANILKAQQFAKPATEPVHTGSLQMSDEEIDNATIDSDDE